MDHINPEIDERKLRDIFKNAVEKGAIDADIHFDAHGTKKDAVENSLIDMIARLSKEQGVLYCKGEIEQAIENNDLYSCSAEIHILVYNYNTLINLGVKYAPIAVEIRAPKKIVLELEEAQSCVLDVGQASQDFAKMFFEKVMNPADFAKFNEQVTARAKLGEMLRNKAAAEKKD
ncbi:MAG: hypothetical protein WC408_02825 [Candidatus Micrarchaeia archaeon]|jgi:hypothetical protein